MILLFSVRSDGKQNNSEPLLGRLIRLEVEGPRDVEDMLENFLTTHGFILVGDEHAPVLRVAAERKRQGDYRECKVSYNIRKLALRMPRGGLAYSFRAKYAHDYGSEEQAANSALYLLKEYLNQDELLIRKLDEIAAAPYYRLDPGEESGEDPGEDSRKESGEESGDDYRDDSRDEKLDDISVRLLEMTMKLEPLLETREELLKLVREQKEVVDPEPGQKRIQEQITRLSEELGKRNGAVSETALAQILEDGRRALRSRSETYTEASPPPDEEPADLSRIEAILIRAPASSGRPVTGQYRIFATNQKVVYQRTETYEGPRIFGSMNRLRSSSMGSWFQSGETHLAIDAARFLPEERTIIVSMRDANAIMEVGRYKKDIFTRGRIAIVPREGKESDL